MSFTPLPFSPLTDWKIKIFFLKKKAPRDIILHKCTKNYDHMMYCSWDMVCDAQTENKWTEKGNYRGGCPP